MTTDEIYKELFNELIKSKVKLYGNLALCKIDKINNLEADRDGNVISIYGDPDIILSELMSKFEEIDGRLTTVISKNLINGIANKYPEFKLPEEFRL